MDAEAALSLGGNVGDVVAAFRYALDRLSHADGVALTRVSSVYRTAPWGKTDQPDFLNIAAIVRTSLSSHALLALCLAIEQECGRVRIERWGPRGLDIDILTFGDRRIAEPDLVIPHPRSRERAFVLVPLAEIAPDWLIEGDTVEAALATLDTAGVIRDDAATLALRQSI